MLLPATILADFAAIAADVPAAAVEVTVCGRAVAGFRGASAEGGTLAGAGLLLDNVWTVTVSAAALTGDNGRLPVPHRDLLYLSSTPYSIRAVNMDPLGALVTITVETPGGGQ